MTARLAADAIAKIQARKPLTRKEASEAFLPILTRAFEGADIAWGTLFALLHQRGAEIQEVQGLVDAVFAYDPAMEKHLQNKIVLDTSVPVVAIAGSGKETFKTFNVSTAAALVASAHPGACIVKPAGRATSATTGASDVLTALGIRLPDTLSQATDMAHRCGLGVFDYHLIAPLYGQRYERLFYNLHPLSHVIPWLVIPYQVDALVFGVADPRVQLSMTAMAAYGVDRAIVVSTGLAGAGRIDELAPFGQVSVATRACGTTEVAHTDLAQPTSAQLQAIGQHSSHERNATAIIDILHGRGPQAATDIVCANAGLLLHLAGVSADRQAGETVARELIAEGWASRQLRRAVEASRKR
jgi:anthranilate phosphoribosyltransferase